MHDLQLMNWEKYKIHACLRKCDFDLLLRYAIMKEGVSVGAYQAAYFAEKTIWDGYFRNPENCIHNQQRVFTLLLLLLLLLLI